MVRAEKVLAIVGTRPEAIKMASVVRAFERHAPAVRCELVVVPQQTSMTAETLQSLEIGSREPLAFAADSFQLPDIAAGIIRTVGATLREQRPSMVLVQGDTTTACMTAIAAHYARLPIGHVEAGLRTGVFSAPFPEEAHRVIIDVIAELCFAPTDHAASNLRAAGISERRIHVTGNPVIDELRRWIATRRLDPGNGKKEVVVTCHRRENFDPGVSQVCEAVARIAATYSDVRVTFVLHSNPRSRDVALRTLAGTGVELSEPMPYRQFIQRLAESWLIMTDSGGMQEEAVALGKPVLVLREHTERPEAIAVGNAELVGTSSTRICARFGAVYASDELYRRMTQPSDVFGDGNAGARIADICTEYLVRHRETIAATEGAEPN
jgi:UDP-N-acetylglucosamine 2-epimerase (non-hydrolysing)